MVLVAMRRNGVRRSGASYTGYTLRRKRIQHMIVVLRHFQGEKMQGKLIGEVLKIDPAYIAMLSKMIYSIIDSPAAILCRHLFNKYNRQGLLHDTLFQPIRTSAKQSG